MSLQRTLLVGAVEEEEMLLREALGEAAGAELLLHQLLHLLQLILTP